MRKANAEGSTRVCLITMKQTELLGMENWSVTAAFEYEIAEDFCFRHLVHCANKGSNSGEERQVNLKQVFVVCL